MSVAKELLKLAVAVLRSASDAKPASKEELNASLAATLAANDELFDVIEAAKEELFATISLAIEALVEVKDPEMSDAIWADPESVPSAVTPVSSEPSPWKEPEKDPDKATPLLPVCI